MTTLASGVLLALAWFAAANAAVSLVAWTIGEVLLAGLEPQTVTKRRLPLRHRGRPALILSVRLLPAAASLLLVAVWFLPAHWRFEPRDSSESFGVVASALAVGGAALLVRSGARALRVARADRVLRAAGLLSPIDVAHHAGEVYELPGLAGVSLAGVLRTRVLVGPAAARELSAPELAVAIDHELAHRSAFDNLKRFAMFCAPDVFGFSTAARRLEEEWSAAAESLADARAVNGDGTRALHLASALVKVARLGAGLPALRMSPSWSTLHHPPLLEVRVRRLVAGVVPAAEPPGFRALAIAALTVASATVAGVTGVAFGPVVHQITEALVRLLP
jgi:hypothetical protein